MEREDFTLFAYIDYERLPELCPTCQNIDHNIANCIKSSDRIEKKVHTEAPARSRKVYVPKNKDVVIINPQVYVADQQKVKDIPNVVADKGKAVLTSDGDMQESPSKTQEAVIHVANGKSVVVGQQSSPHYAVGDSISKSQDKSQDKSQNNQVSTPANINVDPIFGPDMTIDRDLSSGHANILNDGVDQGSYLSQKPDEDSDSLETVYNETELELRDKEFQELEEFVPDSQSVKSTAAETAMDYTNQVSPFQYLSVQAQKDLSLVGKLWEKMQSRI